MTTDIIHAYRHLYRNLLRAVQYAAPARYIARDQLRRAFRQAPSSASPASPASASASSEPAPASPASLSSTSTSATQPLNTEAIKRTIWFLEAAAKERGLEHKILKNLLRVQGERADKVEGWKKVLGRSKSKRGGKDKAEGDMAYEHYDRTVRMLNENIPLDAPAFAEDII
ncbi:hypothetical protein E4U43_007218 [Claviceps pusilla]|uniref:Uncharacterized protein n=1 Tax=Claviceps pusilla TaxID=123648 RepID=A0A9P7NCY8_9HYPO|nr:hypothetical protein E4U43_007218 [Claviceps pusilla]